MLELNNVTKRYKIKEISVTALNNVSVAFPEKGMVFLVGKSGSGKSTLLNISGGLDSPDEGEIILNGKSLKNFSEADFDSYRNTYIGFVFQEFNVLSEYTVEENISLALELQGKPSDAQRVKELLKEVELEGYENRKPDALSGGQRQRVAIARALVKNPQIIMADEPTGALDSATGKQVFDILKKLSAEKLVIVVSHDLDFAEKYADRIIELKDGKIISDVTRDVDGKMAGNKISVKGGVLTITTGEAFSDEDIVRAKTFLSSPAPDKRFSVNKSSFKGFYPTDGDAFIKNREEGEVKLIKSRLPFKRAAAMGASGLRLKPVRLAFTILLSVVAFIVFGMFSTLLTFNKSSVIWDKLSSAEYSGAIIRASAKMEKYSASSLAGEYSYGVLFSDEDISAFNSDNGVNGVGVYNYNQSGTFTLEENVVFSFSDCASEYFYSNKYIKGFCNMEGKDISSYGLTLVEGKYPTGKDEIAISKYMYDYLTSGKFYPLLSANTTAHDDEGVARVVGSYVSLLADDGPDKYFNVKIVGVIDCGEIPEKYDILKEAKLSSYYGAIIPDGYTEEDIIALEEEFADYYGNSFNSVCFVGSAFYEANLSQAMSLGSVKERMARDIRRATSSDNSVSDEELFEKYVYTTEGYKAAKDSNTAPAGMYFITDYNYAAEETGVYQMILLPVENSFFAFSVSSISDIFRNGIKYAAGYSFISELDSMAELIGEIMHIFLAAGLVLAFFAALMLGNFIAASISGREKDIGILRAIGARGADVFKIFATEAAIIALGCYIISLFATLGVCAIVNGAVIGAGALDVALFTFTVPDAFILLAVAALSCFIATFVPVRKAIKKKPVEAIRCL